MLENILLELNDNQKKELAKYALVFVGGMAVGYSIKKALDSIDFDEIMDDAMNRVNNRANYQSEYNLEEDEDIMNIESVTIDE